MIKNTSISPPNEKDSTFLMADYVEILCLCDPDNEISLDDALTSVYHSVESEAEREAKLEEDPDSVEDEPEFKDSQIGAAEDWFRHLEYRKNAFNNFYPFELKNNCLLLKSPPSANAKIYISLLLCSSLRLIEKTFYKSLTSDFELLSVEVLKNYLPSFEVHHFGKSQSGHNGFPNKLSDAINQLAHKLNEQLVSDPKDFEGSTGDGGLDVVAWRLFPNDLKTSGTLVCLAQCACSPDEWGKKQRESSFDTWRKRINFVHPPANFMFIPFCFRGSNGEWFKRDKIESSVLVDRLRICSLLNSSNLTNLNLFQDVNNFIERCQNSSK